MTNFDYLDDLEPWSPDTGPVAHAPLESDVDMLFDAARAHYRVGDYPAALATLATVTRAAPRFLRAQAAEVDTLLQMGLTAQGESQADFLLEAYDANTDLGVARAHGYLHRYRRARRAGDLDNAEFNYDRARQYIDIALEKRPDSRYAWLRRIEAMLALHDRLTRQVALECFDRACAGEQDWVTRVEAGAIAFEWNQLHVADAWLREAVAVAPDEAAGWLWLGRTQWALRWRLHGLESIRRALAIDPDCRPARETLDRLSPVRRLKRALVPWR